ncbi:MAG: diaminopimelate epimerase, partial [Gemmiger sp.]
MAIRFTKMQGCGNDYIYLDCRDTGLPPQASAWSRELSRRRFSVGADGLICICPPLTADGDAAMRIFNADGSEGKMCGNGVRCVAEYLYTHGVRRGLLRIDTPAAGRKTLRRLGPGLWQADMGRFSLRAADLPAAGFGAGPLVDIPLSAAGQSWEVTCLSVGNPHCVIHWPGGTLPAGGTLAALGPAFERHPAFPEGVNTEFVRRLGPTHLEVCVWERGSGATLACGTGACAAAAAMVLRGLCPREQTITVTLPGGSLWVTVHPDDTVLLAGPAVKEGWDDAGVLTFQYPGMAPSFQTVYSGMTNSSLTFTAADGVSASEWQAWTKALNFISLKSPSVSGYVTLDSSKYTIDNAAKTITFDASLFANTGSYSFIFHNTKYANKNVSVT